MLFKKSLMTFVCIITLILFMSAPATVLADDEDTYPPAGDESGTFGGAEPDALIILDLSGSMSQNPKGGTNVWGFDDSCAPNSTCDSTPGLNYGYRSSSGGSCETDCSRLGIAKRAIFNVLDADDNGVINNDDFNALGVRIGYMRFRGGNDTALNYNDGRIKLVSKISEFGSKKHTSYQLTYCGRSTECTSWKSTCTGSTDCVGRGTASGGTPLASSLKEAKKYLDDHKNGNTTLKLKADPGAACRQKFVIVISDGEDTFSCGGSGYICQKNMYKRRRESVAAAKALNDAGYKVFVIGLGADMPSYLTNTLNWMAYYGGTDDRSTANTGNTAAYNMPKNCIYNAASCCVYPSNSLVPSSEDGSCYPAGITNCLASAAVTEDCIAGGVTYPMENSKAGTIDGVLYVPDNDPGYLALSGYAFLAASTGDLTSALKSAFGTISEAGYSFTTISIQAIRTADENFIYEASFVPQECPLWQGHLKRYEIKDNVIQPWDGLWDAASVLNNQVEAVSRHIFTLRSTVSGIKVEEFSKSNTDITPELLAADSEDHRDNIIDFIRKGDKHKTENSIDKYWRLGDIWHSSPVSIGTPNVLFYDRWDKSYTKAYDTFRKNNIRKSNPGTGEDLRLMIVGANDGQLHVFRTGEIAAGGGREMWSFIPPNQLPRLRQIYHPGTEHPSFLDRKYFVDGPTSAAEIWIKSDDDTDISNTSKVVTEWKTLMVTAQGRGGLNTLWSSKNGCDSDFSAWWTSTHTNYCGYYAFDISETNGQSLNTLNDTANYPKYLWRIGGNAGLTEANGKYLAQPWSKMYIGRVRLTKTVVTDGQSSTINYEKWVGLISAGYSGCGMAGKSCPDKGPSVRGKGVYIIDLSDGSVLKSFNNSNTTDMDFDIAASPVAVDHDNDGFLDRAYVGDLGGSMWRIQFCTNNQAISTDGCDTDDWSAAKLYHDASGSGIRPIYTSPTVSLDSEYNLWVYFGTGDKTNPTAANAQERFFAIRDKKVNTTTPLPYYTTGDLDSITASSATDVWDGTIGGWYIQFPASEKVLADPIIYQGRVYFTTYIPDQASETSDPCAAPGSSRIYNMDYITAEGKWKDRKKFFEDEASGVPSKVVFSEGEDGTTKILISTSAKGIKDIVDENVASDPRGSIIYWQDRRIR